MRQFTLALAAAAFPLAFLASLFAQTAPPVVPMNCTWEYVGPGTGWVLVQDGCRGDCPEPAVANPFVGQKEITGCGSAAR